MPVAHLFGWMPKGSVKGFDWLVKNLPHENIVYIGLRDIDEGEKILLEKNKVRFYTPFDIELKGGIGNVMKETLEYLEADIDQANPIHISFDVDGCDPSFITATGTKSRCGLTEREAHFIMRRTYMTGNLVSLDLVEVNTDLDEEDENDKKMRSNKSYLSGCPTLIYSMEFVLSALGDSWRHC